MNTRRTLRCMWLYGWAMPVLGLAGCLPGSDELQTLALNNIQGFFNGVATTAIANFFAG